MAHYERRLIIIDGMWPANGNGAQDMRSICYKKQDHLNGCDGWNDNESHFMYVRKKKLYSAKFLSTHRLSLD